MSRQKNAITLFMTVRGNRKVQQTLRQAEASIGKLGVSIAALGVKGGLAHSVFTKSIGAINRYGKSLFDASVKAAGLATVIGGTLLAAATRLSLRLADVAAETGEVRSLFEQAYTGTALQQMDSHIRELVTILGLSKTELEENASLVAIFGQKAGLAGGELATFGKELLWVGADLTASYGGSFADAMAAIKSGLSGEIEPLKKYGVIMTEADLAAKSAALGFDKAYKAMTVDEKVLVRAAYIKESIGFAAGQALREAGNYATVRRSMDASLRLWQEMLGAPLLEPIKEVFLALRDAGTKWVPQIAAGLEAWVPPADQVGQSVRGILDTVERFAAATASGGLSAGIGELFGPEAKAAFDDLTRLLGAMVDIVAALAAGFIDVFTPFGDKTADGAKSTLTQLADTAEALAVHQDALRDLGATVTQLAPAILAAAGALTAFGKAATVIGQVNGTITTAKAGLGVLNAKASKFTAAQQKKLVNRKAGKALAKAVDAGPIDPTTGLAATSLLGRGKGRLAAAGSALKNPGQLLKGIGPALAKPFQLLGKLNPAKLIGLVTNAIKGLFVIIRANPIAALVTGLIALFVGMWHHSEELRTTVLAAWDAIKAGAAVVMEALGAAFTWFQESIGKPFAQWWASTGGPMVGAALKWLGDTFARILRTVGSVISWLWHNIVVPGFTTMSAMFRGAGQAISAMWTVAQTPMNLIKGAISGVIDAARTGRSWIDGFFNGITNAVNKTWNSIKDYINPIREFFGKPAINTAIRPTVRTPPGSRPADEPIQGRSTGKSLLSGGPGLLAPPPPVAPIVTPKSVGAITGPTGIAVHIGAVNVTGSTGQADANKTARELADAMQRELDRRRFIAGKVR